MITGRERQEGQERLEGRAVPALVLLFVFFTIIRGLGEWTRPVEAALDCDHLAAGDAPALKVLEVLSRCLERRPDDVELMTDLGSAYEQISQWDRAETIYRRALTIDPEDGDIRVRVGNILLRRGDAAAARREGEAAAALQPGRAAALDLVRRAERGQ